MREKTLVKNTVIFMLGNFTSRFLGFLLLPLYTGYLSTEQYGYYGIVTATASIIIPVITLQIGDSLYRYLLDSKSLTEQNKIITNSILVTGAGILIFSVFFEVFTLFVALNMAPLILAYIVTTVLSNFWQQAARGMGKNLVYSIAGVIFTGVMMGANLVLILIAGLKLEAVFYSAILASFVMIVYIELNIGILKRFKAKLAEKTEIVNLAKYSVPLLPNALNWWLMSASNRYIIGIFLGIGANGIFEVSTRFPSILMAFGNVFTLAWQESAIKEYKSEDKDLFYSNMFNIYMKFQFCMLLLLLPVTKWVMQLVVADASYMDAWRYVPLLYVGTVFLAFSTFYGTGYLSSKDTRGAFTTSVVGAVVNVLLTLILVPVIGLQAASFSNMAGFIVLWVLRIFQTKKYFNIRIDKKAFIILAFLSSAFIAIYYLDNIYADFALLVVALLAFWQFNKQLILKSINVLQNKMFKKKGTLN